MVKNILVPIDGSEHSKRALFFACGLAHLYGAKLHLLHVAQPALENKTLVLGGAAITIHATRQELEQVGRQVIEAAETIAAQAGCASVTTAIVGGDPANSIVEKAKQAKVDMIVMGSRGLGDFSGLLLGSVSHKVNHLAPCTCVLVR